ncbi:hypothetical protein E1212_05975 [Jiangella ureilytica]|uniref:Uncharacterized protein n=1 Tax=Jiangella ureilytica TaxID=2530374 RepID=A0A4R4RTX9_9ACTN|nr:hypothetical protein [Jiangella ureilytica]TDC53450.1 hypothetical protein E1212_05975 [Jiangella ureilytica]
MRRVVLGLLLVPVALVAGCGSDGPGASTSGDAACAAPLTFLAEPAVAPGQTVHVQADGLWSGCRDHGYVDEDGRAHYPEPEPTPLTDQVVTFMQGGAKVELTVVDSDPTGAVELDVTIPADAEAGPAVITVGRAMPAALTVVTDEAASPSTSP